MKFQVETHEIPINISINGLHKKALVERVKGLNSKEKG
jgi:hypothetical protein